MTDRPLPNGGPSPCAVTVLPGGRLRRRVLHTDVHWDDLHGYVAACLRVGGILRCCRKHHARCARVYRSLDVARDVAACRDAGALDALHAFLAQGSITGNRTPWGVPLRSVFARAELGMLRMAVENRARAVRSGRADDPRPKGPRFDPPRLPDAALDRLIQTHPDRAIVDRLRAERRRREAGAGS